MEGDMTVKDTAEKNLGQAKDQAIKTKDDIIEGGHKIKDTIVDKLPGGHEPTMGERMGEKIDHAGHVMGDAKKSIVENSGKAKDESESWIHEKFEQTKQLIGLGSDN